MPGFSTFSSRAKLSGKASSSCTPVISCRVKMAQLRALFAAHRAGANDQACDGEFFAVALAFDLLQREHVQFFQAGREFIQRMAGDVEAQHGVFAGEPFFFRQWRSFAQIEMDFRLRGATAEEQSVLPGFPRARGALHRDDRVVHGGKHLLRVLPKESTAPDLIRLSKTRLFKKRGSMRSQKS